VSLTSWIRNLFSGSPAEPPQQAAPLGRNDLCWCGSGQKYKRCHLKSDGAKQREAAYAAHFSARNQLGDGVVPGKPGKKVQPRPDEFKSAVK
jgi:hypothetical protein